MTIDEVTGATIGVEVLLELPAEQVWAGITAIERYGEWSPECTYGAWLGEPLVVGSRFAARNEFPDGTKTQVVCVVTQVEPVRRFGWEVYGGEGVPLALDGSTSWSRGARTLSSASDSPMALATAACAEEPKQRRHTEPARRSSAA